APNYRLLVPITKSCGGVGPKARMDAGMEQDSRSKAAEAATKVKATDDHSQEGNRVLHRRLQRRIHRWPGKLAGGRRAGRPARQRSTLLQEQVRPRLHRRAGR